MIVVRYIPDFQPITYHVKGGPDMTDLETLERAKTYMEKLANGINPLDNSIIPDNDVVNNVRLSRCFFYIADVLRQVIDNGGVTKQKKEKKQKDRPQMVTAWVSPLKPEPESTVHTL